MRKWMVSLIEILAWLVIIAIGTVFAGNLLVLAVDLLLVFCLIALSPAAKGRENTYMFALASLVLLWTNIQWAVCVAEIYGNDWIFFINFLSRSFLVLFSVEQILLGLITRFIWRHQSSAVFGWEEET